MSRLTKRERAAIRTALAMYLANDHDEQEFDGFDLEDADTALSKVQERECAPAGRTTTR